MSADALREGASALPWTHPCQPKHPEGPNIFFLLFMLPAMYSSGKPEVSSTTVSIVFNSTKDRDDAHTGLVKGKGRQFRGVT